MIWDSGLGLGLDNFEIFMAVSHRVNLLTKYSFHLEQGYAHPFDFRIFDAV